jgi:hypothetical protein
MPKLAVSMLGEKFDVVGHQANLLDGRVVVWSGCRAHGPLP